MILISLLGIRIFAQFFVMAEIKEKKQDLEAISDIFAEADEDSKANDIDEENVLVNPELVAEVIAIQ